MVRMKVDVEKEDHTEVGLRAAIAPQLCFVSYRKQIWAFKKVSAFVRIELWIVFSMGSGFGGVRSTQTSIDGVGK